MAINRRAVSGCSNWNPFENLEKRQKAANLCVVAYLQQASQALDTGSIPVACSRIIRNKYILHNKRAAVLKSLLLLKGNQRIIVINVPWYLEF
jgi:hypothetical protein